jgi:type III secretion protein V
MASTATSSSIRELASGSLLQRLIEPLARHGHFALVALVMGVVALMVLPVPPVVLDLLIAFNIAASVLLLMLAIYIPGALGMSTFPSLIVLTTVLRLSLNIASTKQILLHAHAGNIIETFGRLVMGGQVVVGLVVFAIIAVVQFIVISKGAERVAEVGARFTLDAMPGKQMSIEADLRGGLIDKHEAKRQRALLEQESHMHGSMDGAMKFVKGDAIAAIIIALVNIIAGMYVGSAVHGMSIGDAVARYTLLSVGDGMVSQIPSLLTSVAAGVLITRVAGQEGRPRNLASQIGRQVWAQPLALLAAGAVLFAFVLVPGFPKVPFIVLGAGMALMGWWALRKSRCVPSFERAGATPAALAAAAGTAHAEAEPTAGDADIVSPLTLRLAANLRERMSPAALQLALEAEKRRLQRELGLGFPSLQVRFDDQLADDTYAIDVQEIAATAVALVGAAGDQTLAAADEPARAVAASDDVGGVVMADSDEIDDAVAAENELARAVATVVRLRPDAFVGMQEINALVKRVQLRLPDLSDEINRAMPAQRVAEIMRRLALEGVSLRYMREIYESLLVWAPREKDTAMLCEHVRVDLGRFICHRLADSESRLHAIMVDGPTEALVRESVKQGASGAYMALPPATVKELTTLAAQAVSALPKGQPAVLLTTQETRRFLRRMLATRLPQLSVLSYPELPADTLIHPVGRLALPNTAALRVVSE